MRRCLALMTLAVALCACQAPQHKRFVPQYTHPTTAVGEPDGTGEAELATALQQYAAEGSTDSLQAYFSNHTELVSGQAAEQILSLDQRVRELDRELQGLRQRQQACEQHRRQAEEQAANFKAQLDALAESLIRQEKRLP